MRTPFIGPAYTLNSVNAACQRCVNLYPEMYEVQPGKEQEVALLVSTPGLTVRPFITIANSGPIRAMYTSSKGFAFTVSGKHVFYYDNSTGVTSVAGTLAGELLTVSGPVSVADNGIALVLVDGPYGYVVDISGAVPGMVTQIISENFLGADRVSFIDGYFAFNKPGTQQYYITGIYDTNFAGLDFASAEGNPDELVSLISTHRELWLFGVNTTEIHYNSGRASFPFERIQGAFIEFGCAAAHSVVRVDNSIMWLSRDENGQGVVVQAVGYQAKRVSTYAMEQIIQSAGNIEDAVAYAYQKDGHTFYALNFTSANTTIAYDLSSRLWHERAYLNTETGDLERHRAQCHMLFGGHNLVGDYATGAVYSLESQVYSDAGNPIPRIRSSPHITGDLNEVFHHSFQLDIETGVGLDGDAAASGADPVAMLRWSDDGGHTWSRERWRKLGKIGEFKRKAKWNRLGRSRDRVYEVRITDPIKVTITGAAISATVGKS